MIPQEELDRVRAEILKRLFDEYEVDVEIRLTLEDKIQPELNLYKIILRELMFDGAVECNEGGFRLTSEGYRNQREELKKTSPQPAGSAPRVYTGSSFK